MRIKYLVMILLMFMLVGCSNRVISLDGKSENWRVMLTNSSAAEMVEFTIRYIGDEQIVKDVHYQFGGQEFDANGYEEHLGMPQRHIKHASGSKFLDLEPFPMPVHIQWNEDQVETVYLQGL
ncbi:hypothetical protein [Paenibacillus sp. FSL R7-0652]|uniref:Uncharacterized protein n=1 Tax=Paenibacillus sp. AN1007 TaxID=3151385 RepID=A0AAU8NEX1_9BACL